MPEYVYVGWVRIWVWWLAGVSGRAMGILTWNILFWTSWSLAFFLKSARRVLFRMVRLKLSVVPSFQCQSPWAWAWYQTEACLPSGVLL